MTPKQLADIQTTRLEAAWQLAGSTRSAAAREAEATFKALRATVFALFPGRQYRKHILANAVTATCRSLRRTHE